MFFKNESDVQKILKRKRELRSIEGFQRIYINESKPWHQRVREAQERRRNRFDRRHSSFRGGASFFHRDPYQHYDHDPYYPYDRPEFSSSGSYRRDFSYPKNWGPPRSSRWEY